MTTAIEACGRLAATGDERRIARGIFLAENMFESGDWGDEKDKVWKAGWTALKQLPSDAVVDELLIALRDPISYRSGRWFQVDFFTQQEGVPHAAIVRTRSEEIIAAFVMRVPPDITEDSAYLMEATSTVWRNSNRPMSDFEGLSVRMLKMISDGFVKDDTDTNVLWNSWIVVARNVVAHAPETPDLAIILAKHAAKNAPKTRWVLELIGKLGSRAEPAVPLLVELFLNESKKLEGQVLRDATNLERETPSESINDVSDRSHAVSGAIS